jgi:uroporphyrinogen decarboxylase
VPVQLQNMALAVQGLGLDFPQVCGDGVLVAEGHIREWQSCRHDGVVVDIGTHAAAQALGCPAEYPPGEIPRVAGRAIDDWRQVPGLRVPPPEDTFPLAVMLQAVGILKREIGAHCCLIATVDQGPFTLASQLYGMERFLLELGTEGGAEAAGPLLSFCAAFTLRYGRALHRAGADVIRMGDSMSGPELISPAMYRRFAFPYQRSLAQELRREGIAFDFHICGNATAIIHDMVATGAAYVEIDEKTDLGEARRAVALHGGIGGPISPRALRFESPEAVAGLCREVLELWLPQGGLFFGSGCTLAPDTPEENIRQLLDCAERYGRYAGSPAARREAAGRATNKQRR